MVARKSALSAALDGCWLSFSTHTKGAPSWSFRILARDEQAARMLANALKRKEVYSLSPDDYGVRTILISREDWGSEPKWIGGDISIAGVDPRLYTMGGNHAYVRSAPVPVVADI